MFLLCQNLNGHCWVLPITDLAVLRWMNIHYFLAKKKFLGIKTQVVVHRSLEPFLTSGKSHTKRLPRLSLAFYPIT